MSNFSTYPSSPDYFPAVAALPQTSLDHEFFRIDNGFIYIDTQIIDIPAFQDRLRVQLENPQLQKEFIEEAREGLGAIQAITKAFRDINILLRLVDHKKFNDRNGERIPLFLPTWEGYHRKFEDLITWCELFASASVGTIRSYREHVLRLINSPISLEQKEKSIAHFLETLERDESEPQLIDIETGFSELTSEVRAFRERFIITMDEVGMGLDRSVAAITKEIHILQERLGHYQENARVLQEAMKLGKGSRRTAKFMASCAAFIHSASVITPKTLFKGALEALGHYGERPGKEFCEEIEEITIAIQEKSAEWHRLRQKQTQYQQLRPAIDLAARDIDTISEKLLILTRIFKLIRKDCVVVQNHLRHLRHSSKDTAMDQLDEGDIELAFACYSRLEVLLDAFSVGCSVSD